MQQPNPFEKSYKDNGAWKRWLATFENYLKATNKYRMQEDVKIATSLRQPRNSTHIWRILIKLQNL